MHETSADNGALASPEAEGNEGPVKKLKLGEGIFASFRRLRNEMLLEDLSVKVPEPEPLLSALICSC